MKKAFLAMILLTGFSVSALATEPLRQTYECKSSTHKMKLDVHHNAPGWDSSVVVFAYADDLGRCMGYATQSEDIGGASGLYNDNSAGSGGSGCNVGGHAHLTWEGSLRDNTNKRVTYNPDPGFGRSRVYNCELQ
jgi:hypothetical protein